MKLALLAILACVLLADPAPAGAAPGQTNGKLAYEGRASSSGAILVREPGRGGTRRLSVPGSPADPAFSPLGRRIAFTSRSEIWTMYEDGTSLRQVTVGAEPSRDPTWSPTGDVLAFATGSEGDRDLYSIGADGSGLTQLTRGGADDEAPAWSSRDRIAFVRAGSGRDGDVYGMAAGGRPRALTRGGADDRSPAWSPSGSRIAFTRLAEKPARKKGKRRSKRPAKRVRELWIMRENGGRKRRLAKLPAAVSAPTWSPDGRRIAFAMGRDGRRGLFAVRSSGRGLRRIAAAGADARSIDWQPRGSDPVVAAAGDIACDPGAGRFATGLGTSNACHMLQTSDLLMRMDLSAILPLGDEQYEDGAYDKFLRSFDPTWGRLKGLMRPVPGNHQYQIRGAAGYFDYFNGVGAQNGPAGPRGRGYYSFDVGGWHVVALNSQCSHPARDDGRVGCEIGSEQERWLRADLAANRSRCTLAYMHHPLVSSGLGEFNAAVQPLWQALYDEGAEIVLAGHHHSYERFAPMAPEGSRDGERGLRQFVVGTGGRSHHAMGAVRPNSEVRDDATFGVLKLTLRPDAYLWEFVPEAGATFTDAGANACH